MNDAHKLDLLNIFQLCCPTDGIQNFFPFYGNRSNKIFDNLKLEKPYNF